MCFSVSAFWFPASLLERRRETVGGECEEELDVGKVKGTFLVNHRVLWDVDVSVSSVLSLMLSELAVSRFDQ